MKSKFTLIEIWVSPPISAIFKFLLSFSNFFYSNSIWKNKTLQIYSQLNIKSFEPKKKKSKLKTWTNYSPKCVKKTGVICDIAAHMFFKSI